MESPNHSAEAGFGLALSTVRIEPVSHWVCETAERSTWLLQTQPVRLNEQSCVEFCLLLADLDTATKKLRTRVERPSA